MSGPPAPIGTAKVLGTHYSYPWNHEGSQYNYDEVDLEAVYRGWLDMRLTYSPDSPRYMPHRGLIAVSAESAEVGVQHPLVGKLSGNAGIGYYYLEGAERHRLHLWQRRRYL